MKQWIFIFFIFPLSVFCYGQGYLDSLPIINKGEILVLGEYHFLQEMQDVEHDIILNYSKTSQDLVVVFLERPYHEVYYVNQLFENGDSLRLKKYAKLMGTISGPYFYNLIMFLYEINQKVSNLKIVCIDDNRLLRRALYTIRELLNTYPNCPESIQKMKYQADSLLQTGIPKSKAENEKYVPLFEKFKKEFQRHKKDYKKTLSESDFEILTHIFKDHTESYDIRESIMFRNICKHYQKECRHIVIVGNTHANKEKILFSFGKISYNPKTKPLAWQLNNINKSPFRHKVYTIHLTPQNIIFPETIINDSLTIASKEVTWIVPSIPNHIRKELEAQKKDVAIKMINPFEYPDIHRQYDGFILIKKAHSSIPGNKETIENNW